jgi:hypothetical protein
MDAYGIQDTTPEAGSPESAQVAPGLPVSADLYHVYLDTDSGTWGDRKSLVMVTLTEPELQRLECMTTAQVKAMAGKGARYFGNVAEVTSRRRHLTSSDFDTYLMSTTTLDSQ